MNVFAGLRRRNRETLLGYWQQFKGTLQYFNVADPIVDICTHALYERVVHNIINYNLFHPSISTGHYVAHGII